MPPSCRLIHDAELKAYPRDSNDAAVLDVRGKTMLNCAPTNALGPLLGRQRRHLSGVDLEGVDYVATAGIIVVCCTKENQISPCRFSKPLAGLQVHAH